MQHDLDSRIVLAPVDAVHRLDKAEQLHWVSWISNAPQHMLLLLVGQAV
jgi:hypothetical protein